MATKKASKPAAAKPGKTAAPKKAPGVKKPVAKKKAPTEEEIRRKAEEIYHDRIAKGIHGTAEDDWHQAEKLLKGKK